MAALIAAQRDERRIPPAVACRALGVSRSWFYKHQAGGLPPRAARRAVLAAEVRRLFGAHRGTCGSPRIAADLREAGWRVSENTVARLMREQGLAARRTKRRRSAVIIGDPPLPLCPVNSRLTSAFSRSRRARRGEASPRRHL